MADGDDPIRPRPPAPPRLPTPGQPMPRVWKAEPEPEADDAPPRKSRRERLAEEKEAANPKAAPNAKPKAKAKPGGSTGKAGKDVKKPKGRLIEETPEFETHEARQRVRLMIGGLLAGSVVLGIVYLLQFLGGSNPEMVDLPDEGAPASTASQPAPNNLDMEAMNLLDNARRLAGKGNAQGAMVVLNKVVTTYPKTPAAAEARQALDRPSRNLPLFLAPSTVVASPGEAAPTAAGQPVPVVRAEAVRPPSIRPGATAEASLDLPPNPAEAPRSAPTGAVAPGSAVARVIPAGFRARTEAGVHASGWPNQIVSDRDGATLVLVPAGTYVQGRDDASPEEGPEHKVVLGPFYVDQHEVTVRQFALFLKETGGKPLPARATAKGEGDPEELPVVNVTAHEAKAYCDWAAERLPTEAQWEAAARTTDGRLYPWGSNSPVWGRPRQPRQIDEVMSYPLDQSPYGVFDLAGNAWEYTKDYYDPRYYQQFRGRVADNPLGPASSRSRPPQVVVKGTSKAWLVSAREGLKVDGRFPYVGFRGVLPVEEPTATATPTTTVAPTPGASPSTPSPTITTTPGGVIPF